MVKNHNESARCDKRHPVCCGKCFVPFQYLSGLLTPRYKDAVLAAEAGVEGIIISNHGGEHLASSLPQIIDRLQAVN